MTDLLPVPLGERNNLTSELCSEQPSSWSVRFMAFDCICAVPVLSHEWHETWWSCQRAWGNHCFFFQILAMGNSFKVSMELPLMMCLPQIFQLQTLLPVPILGKSWVCSTVGWGGAICLEVIPTYWKPPPQLYFGQMSLPGSSGLSLLACNTQAPRGWWVPYTDVVEGTTASCCSLSPTVFQQWCESKMGFAFWNISSFCFQAGRNEISPSTSALLFILFSALSLSGSVAHLVMSLQTLGQGIISPDFSYLKLRHKV